MGETIFEHRQCPACNASNSREEVRSDSPAETMTFDELRAYWTGFEKEKIFFSYHRCRGCGLLFAPTFFSQDQLGELYAEMAPNMELVPTDALEATQLGYWKVAAAAGTLDGDYLEIGPDIGYIVRHAAVEGAFDRFWLFEPNRAVHPQLAEATGGKPHSISVQMDDLSVVPDGSVGMAVMVHVLDHLLDPLATLDQVRTKLKPGGTLIVVTHSEASMLRKVMRKRWPPFCLQHPEIYSPTSISSLIRRARYSSVSVARSTNYFPVAFLARHAAWLMGVRLPRIPLADKRIGLKLGNMITVATR